MKSRTGNEAFTHRLWCIHGVQVQEGRPGKVLRTLAWKPRPEFGRDCLYMCRIRSASSQGHALTASIQVESRANMAHIRQSRPDSGLGFQANALKTVEGVPFSLGSGHPGPISSEYGTYKTVKTLGFQANVLKPIEGVPSWLGRGESSLRVIALLSCLKIFRKRVFI